MSTDLSGLLMSCYSQSFHLINQRLLRWTRSCKKKDNNRGARLFPLIFCCDEVTFEKQGPDCKFTTKNGEHFGNLIEVLNQNGCTFILIRAKRQYHLEAKNVEICHNELNLNGDIILIYDLLKDYFLKTSEDLFYESVDLLNSGDDITAKGLLTLSILLNPENVDSIEALGVFYGRQNNFALGHALMDRLLSIDKSSIMAHTNKSLFFMNEGKIEEAELQKDLALQKSLSKDLENNHGDDSGNVERTNKLNKQLEMYKEVLEIDPDDEFAQTKFVEILYEIQEYGRIVKYLDSIKLENKPKLFVWLVKSVKMMNGDISEIAEGVEAVLQYSLKVGDKKSADYLKNLCK